MNQLLGEFTFELLEIWPFVWQWDLNFFSYLWCITFIWQMFLSKATHAKQLRGLKIPFKCPCTAVVATMFRIICQEQLQHRICANKTFCAASCISRFEGFIKLLKNETQVSVRCRLLFACLSDPVCLCAVASHHCSVQTELWTAAPPPPPPPPQDRQHRTKRNPVWPSAYAEWCHHMHT